MVTSHTEVRQRLPSASSTSLDSDVLVCPLSVTERFLLQPLVCGTVFHHTSLLPPLSIVCCHLKSHLFSLSYPAFWLFSHLYSARTWLIILVTVIVITFNIYYCQMSCTYVECSCRICLGIQRSDHHWHGLSEDQAQSPAEYSSLAQQTHN